MSREFNLKNKNYCTLISDKKTHKLNVYPVIITGLNLSYSNTQTINKLAYPLPRANF